MEEKKEQAEEELSSEISTNSSKTIVSRARVGFVLKTTLTVIVMVGVYWFVQFLFANSTTKIGSVKLVLILNAAFVATAITLTYVFSAQISRQLSSKLPKLHSVIKRCVAIVLFGYLLMVENSLVECCVEYLKLGLKNLKITWFKPYNSEAYVKNILLLIVSIHVIVLIKSTYDAINGLSKNK